MATKVLSFRNPPYFRRSHMSFRQITTSNSTTTSLPCDTSSFTSYRAQTFLSPPLKPCSIRTVTAGSHSNLPLISPNDHWGTWTALFATGAFGLCCNNNWNSSSICVGANAITWSGWLENSSCTHGQTHWWCCQLRCHF